MSNLTDILVKYGADPDLAAEMDQTARVGFSKPGGRITPEDASVYVPEEGESFQDVLKQHLNTAHQRMVQGKPLLGETPEEFQFGEQLYDLSGDADAQEAFLREKGFRTTRSKDGKISFLDPKDPTKVHEVPDAMGTAWNRHVLAPIGMAAAIPGSAISNLAGRAASSLARGPFVKEALRTAGTVAGEVGLAAGENVAADLYEDELRQRAGVDPKSTSDSLQSSALAGGGWQAAFEGIPLAKRFLNWSLGNTAESMAAYERAVSRQKEKVSARNAKIDAQNQTIADRERKLRVRVMTARDRGEEIQNNIARGAADDLYKQQRLATEKVTELERKRDSIFGDAAINEAAITKITQDLGLDPSLRPKHLSGTLQDIEQRGRAVRNAVFDSAAKWDEELQQGAKQVFSKSLGQDLGPPDAINKLAAKMNTGDHELSGILLGMEIIQSKYQHLDALSEDLFQGVSFKQLPPREQGVVIDAARKHGLTQDWTVGEAVRTRGRLVEIAKKHKDPLTRSQALTLVDGIDEHLINSGVTEGKAFDDLRNQMMFRREAMDQGFKTEMAKAQDPVTVMTTLAKRMRNEPGPSLAMLRKMKDANPDQFEAIKYSVLDDFFEEGDASKAVGELSKFHPEVLKELLGTSSVGKIGNLAQVRAELTSAGNYVDQLLASPGGEERLEAAFKRVAQSPEGQKLAGSLADAQRALSSLPSEEDAVKAALQHARTRDPLEAAALAERRGRAAMPTPPKAPPPLRSPHDVGVDAFINRSKKLGLTRDLYLHAAAASLLYSFGIEPYAIPGIVGAAAISGTAKKTMAALLMNKDRAEETIRLWRTPLKNEDDLARRILRMSAIAVSREVGRNKEETPLEATPDDVQRFLETQGVPRKDPNIKDGTTLGQLRSGKTPNIQKDLENGKRRIGEVEGLLNKADIPAEIEQLSRAPIEKQILVMARSGRKDIAEVVMRNMEKAVQALPPEEQQKLIDYFEKVYAKVTGGSGGGN